MIKSIKAILAQDKEKFKVPRKVQNLIPIKNIWPDGIFKVGNKFSKSFRFSDINYLEGISSPNPSDSRTSTIWWRAARTKRACF